MAKKKANKVHQWIYELFFFWRKDYWKETIGIGETKYLPTPIDKT